MSYKRKILKIEEESLSLLKSLKLVVAESCTEESDLPDISNTHTKVTITLDSSIDEDMEESLINSLNKSIENIVKEESGHHFSLEIKHVLERAHIFIDVFEK